MHNHIVKLTPINANKRDNINLRQFRLNSVAQYAASMYEYYTRTWSINHNHDPEKMWQNKLSIHSFFNAAHIDNLTISRP
jgi:hypothetical protein